VERTAGSRSKERHRLKSGPYTVADKDLRRILMITSGLLNWGLNWYLSNHQLLLTGVRDNGDRQFENSKIREEIVYPIPYLTGQVILHQL